MADAVACTVRLPPTLAPIYLHLDDRSYRFKTTPEPGGSRDTHGKTHGSHRDDLTSQRSNARARRDHATTPVPTQRPTWGRRHLDRAGIRSISSAPRSLRTHKCAGSRIAMLLLFFLPSRRRQNALLSAPRARANPLTSSHSAATPPSATCSSPLLPLI